LRNIDEIREQPFDQSSKVGALVLASFGGACIVFAALALMRAPDQAALPEKSDPLGELVKSVATPKRAQARAKLDSSEVTFPGILTDRDNPTTSMEAVRARRGRRAKSGATAVRPLPAGVLPNRPPPPTDRLPVVPLPAKDMVGRARVKVAAPDTLSRIARGVSREPVSAKLAEEGRAGAYQLQVSSFKKADDATQFALALRRRGHKAHVEKAHVKGRGIWYRVRIGPFKYKRSAQIYRQDFEAKERMVTFVVNPPRTRVKIALSGDES